MTSDKSISELDGSFDTEESTINCDTEDEHIDESAIDDDDDSSNWEDSSDKSGKPSVDEKFFQHVESKANLYSRLSLITQMIADDRAKILGNHASQSTSALTRSQSAGSMATSPNNSNNSPSITQGAQSSAQSIVTTPSHIYAQAALSPRTTRRNMLATELTESLRRGLLWERQQKSSTANAVLKRGYTFPSITNIEQYPERACLKQSEDADIGSWNGYIDNIYENSGYHSRGW